MRRVHLLVLSGLLLAALARATPAEEGGQKWAVLVGIDRYESSEITALRYAVADVEAVARALEETAGFPRENIFVLTDRGAGRELARGNNILFRVGDVARRTQPGDTFVFYFSGHGVERGEETYLLSYDADLGNELTLQRTAVRTADLKQAFAGIRASQVLTFMDCCRNDPASGKGSAANLLTDTMSRDLQMVPASAGGQAAAFTSTFYSCSPGERSYESPEHGQGFFSYFLVKGLRGEAADGSGRVTLDALETYLSREVKLAVDRQVGRSQTPWAERKGTAGSSVVLALGGARPEPSRPEPERTAAPARPQPAPAADPKALFDACCSNLKNIGTALEMYMTDHPGEYRGHLADLVPDYLKAIPTCPAAGVDTYSATFSWVPQRGRPNDYEFGCGGAHHSPLAPVGFPAYTSQTGLLTH